MNKYKGKRVAGKYYSIETVRKLIKENKIFIIIKEKRNERNFR